MYVCMYVYVCMANRAWHFVAGIQVAETEPSKVTTTFWYICMDVCVCVCMRVCVKSSVAARKDVLLYVCMCVSSLQQQPQPQYQSLCHKHTHAHTHTHTSTRTHKYHTCTYMYLEHGPYIIQTNTYIYGYIHAHTWILNFVNLTGHPACWMALYWRQKAQCQTAFNFSYVHVCVCKCAISGLVHACACDDVGAPVREVKQPCVPRPRQSIARAIMYIHTYIHVYSNSHVGHAQLSRQCKIACSHVHTCTHTHTYIQAHSHRCWLTEHTWTYIHTCTHTHQYIQARGPVYMAYRAHFLAAIFVLASSLAPRMRIFPALVMKADALGFLQKWCSVCMDICVHVFALC
jgi:hypothetical protein